ncbi:peroxide stress protein YaaA [Chitinivorax sp. B]|uniref:peroxide stress protein YaaA n=1 Tax=Chitinivorax sp. B TaxID=2502235 RepID=UPI0010F8D31B|nr:peroxide stress protein YaaA [Chitinivorax sp. B]
MLMVISPAKTLDYTTLPTTSIHTRPDYLNQSHALIQALREFSPADIRQLMDISDELAVLNAGRFQSWQPNFTLDNAKQAVLAFMGDVYEGLQANAFDDGQLTFLQQHLRILSGLYGLLRPLDLMQPYRLEMGTRLANPKGKDLYAYWGDTLTDGLNALLAGESEPVLVNLASDEYFKAVKPKKLNARLITPVFQDWKNGQYKIISFYAKRARGLMVRYAVMNRVEDPLQLKLFDYEGYALAGDVSTDTTWVFRRQLA